MAYGFIHKMQRSFALKSSIFLAFLVLFSLGMSQFLQEFHSGNEFKRYLLTHVIPAF
jgi:hypothetical protein